MNAGERIQVSAYKSDGTCYRKWVATVESADRDEIVVVTPAGHPVSDTAGDWSSEYAIRAHYWPNKHYSLLEVYEPSGSLVEVYVNICSPVELLDSGLMFTDFELDVSRLLPREARIVDEKEFLEAASAYGYSPDFQQLCYAVAREAVALANSWVGKGSPEISSE